MVWSLTISINIFRFLLDPLIEDIKKVNNKNGRRRISYLCVILCTIYMEIDDIEVIIEKIEIYISKYVSIYYRY